MQIPLSVSFRVAAPAGLTPWQKHFLFLPRCFVNYSGTLNNGWLLVEPPPENMKVIEDHHIPTMVEPTQYLTPSVKCQSCAAETHVIEASNGNPHLSQLLGRLPIQENCYFPLPCLITRGFFHGRLVKV